jgi:hypothetical protein
LLSLCRIRCSRWSNKPIRGTFALAQHLGILRVLLCRKFGVSGTLLIYGVCPESGHVRSLRTFPEFLEECCCWRSLQATFRASIPAYTYKISGITLT